MKPDFKPHVSSESGFTLLELLLVVGVGALLLIGGIATYRLVSEGNKVTDATRMIMTIRNEASNLSQGQGYAGVRTSLVAAKIISDTQKDPWGGALGINDTGATLVVTLPAVPPNACRKLAMSIKDQGVKLNGNPPPATLSDTTCGDADSPMAWSFP